MLLLLAYTNPLTCCTSVPSARMQHSRKSQAASGTVKRQGAAERVNGGWTQASSLVAGASRQRQAVRNEQAAHPGWFQPKAQRAAWHQLRPQAAAAASAAPP